MQLMGHNDIRTAKKYYIDQETQNRAQKNKEFMKHMSATSGLLDQKNCGAPKLAPKGQNLEIEDMDILV